MTDQAPWNLFKTDPEKFKQVLFVLLELLANISIMLQPFIPKTATKIQKALGVSIEKLPISYGKVREGFRVDPTGILFQKKDNIHS